MKKISFSLLVARELYTMGLRLHNLLSGSVQNDPFLTSLLARMKESLDTLSAILGRVPGSEYTLELFTKDGLRDNAFIGLRDFIKANINNVSSEISLR